jgi:2,5-diketo-D-gluconate reductase B
MTIEGRDIPLLGLGTWNLSGNQCVNTVTAALEMGYRHLDTAHIYDNEKEVGNGIKKSEVPREEIFVTTKISTGDLHPDAVIPAAERSLQKLQTGYIDLLLIHWPTLGLNLKKTLNEMFRLKDQGKVRHVGVSNFGPELFKQAIDSGPVICNQVKFHIHKRQDENLEIAKSGGLMITAYSPLDEGRSVKDPLLLKLAQKYSRTPAQIALRWLLQQGNISVIPKASGDLHLQENMQIFDFELAEDDMMKISGSNRSDRLT